MKNTIALTMAITVGGFVHLGAQAQNLSIAMEQAWSRHPLAAASAARTDEALARMESANGLTPAPASVSLANVNDQLNANRGKQEWELEVATPLWLPGQSAARQNEATALQAEMVTRQQASRLQLAADLREAWWALAGARNAQTTAQDRLHTANALALDVQRRYKVGELARVDTNLAQNEQMAAQAELVDTQTAVALAEQNLQSLTGVAPPDTLPAEAGPAQTPPLEAHPLMRSANAATQLAQSRLQLAQHSSREAPTLAVRMLRSRSDLNDSYADALGIKLTVPFSSGSRVRQEDAGARAELTQADAELAQVQQRVQFALDSARRDKSAAERQLAFAETRVQLTADNLVLAETSFALGESDLSTLLRARAAALEAHALRNRYQVGVSAAQSRLNQSMGVLP
ncbi:TolC family protein [Candidatus Aalborgicola defluviihabitans]|jgi:outer membrane protein TolC|uniref:TolC family protein n=1 Tax=Candidatus Aalborgicola defluviihabitans TaxID=3386187 RepID=UPI001D4E60CD|nr:TolC family protein [Burkholderiales bacterium]MBK6567672.1 TolC family protein [Burkholderiales bacterium]MBK7282285.1 TolC family protein [Burkholderiales bacterium]MBK7314877.1 TolC family protein [Burkholderiales bacterium]